MSISRELFLAILSMDSYNRGYGSGLGAEPDGLGSTSDGSSQVGAAAVSFNLEDAGISQAAQSAGFYAVAYEVSAGEGLTEDTVLISYRGTDAPAALQ